MCRPRETNVLDPPSDHWTPPFLKSDDLFLGNQEILDPPFQKSWTRLWYKMNKDKDTISLWLFPWRSFSSKTKSTPVLRSCMSTDKA